MEVFIGIAELAANAFITIMEQRIGAVPVMSLKALEEYGAAVRECGLKSNVVVIPLYSRASTEFAFRNYNDYFARDCDDNVILKDGVTAESLKDKFRTYRCREFINIFETNEVVKCLLRCIRVE